MNSYVVQHINSQAKDASIKLDRYSKPKSSANFNMIYLSIGVIDLKKWHSVSFKKVSILPLGTGFGMSEISEYNCF